MLLRIYGSKSNCYANRTAGFCQSLRKTTVDIPVTCYNFIVKLKHLDSKLQTTKLDIFPCLINQGGGGKNEGNDSRNKW